MAYRRTSATKRTAVEIGPQHAFTLDMVCVWCRPACSQQNIDVNAQRIVTKFCVDRSLRLTSFRQWQLTSFDAVASN